MTTSAKQSLVVAWTGHRRLDNEELVARAVASVVEELASGHRSGPCSIVGVGSVAIGTDTLIAEALHARGVPLIITLPFERDRFETEATDAQRARIAQLLDSARLVQVTPRLPTDQQAYLEAGAATVERADVLVAVWDRQPARGQGGTEEVVGYAHALRKPVIVIDPATGAVQWPVFKQTPPGSRGAMRTLDDVRRTFDELDQAASAHSSLSRLVLFWVVALHLAASAVAIGAAIIIGEHGHLARAIIPGAIKVGALIWALALAMNIRPKHKHWLEARAGAELCRSFLAVWEMRREFVVLPPAPTFSTESLRRELELAWLLNPPTGDLAGAKAMYLARSGKHEPFDPRRRVREQLRYFNREKKRAAAIGHNLELAAKATTVSAIVLGIAAIVMKLAAKEALGDGLLYHCIKALSIILPLATAAMLYYATARDLTRRMARFREMARRLQAIKCRVRAAQTWPSLGRAVTDAEFLLLSELGEWHAFTRYAGELHS